MVKQMAENETADQADWLIGEGCLMPGVKGVSLRNMKNPGTAYNDPRFVSLSSHTTQQQDDSTMKIIEDLFL